MRSFFINFDPYIERFHFYSSFLGPHDVDAEARRFQAEVWGSHPRQGRREVRREEERIASRLIEPRES